MNLTEREWKQLAENVHLGGYEYYIHKENRSIIEVPSEELLSFDDTIELEEVRNEFEDKHEMFERIMPMDNETAFELMEDFSDQLPDSMDKDKLEECLRGRYPFRRFKELIGESENLHSLWLNFRNQKEISWVKKQINQIFEPEEDLL